MTRRETAVRYQRPLRSRIFPMLHREPKGLPLAPVFYPIVARTSQLSMQIGAISASLFWLSKICRHPRIGKPASRVALFVVRLGRADLRKATRKNGCWHGCTGLAIRSKEACSMLVSSNQKVVPAETKPKVTRTDRWLFPKVFAN